MDNKRPQDKWNQKAGYISKSYKINKVIIDDFANACITADTTQAGQLSRFMKTYSEEISRRNEKMVIRGKYYSDNDDSVLLQNLVNEYVFNYTDDIINNEYARMKEMIKNKNKGEKISSVLEYTKEFRTNNDLHDYLLGGADDVIRFIKEQYINQIALFMLMNENLIMPVRIRNNMTVELNINHNRGNSLFDLYFDLLPYDVYIII